METRSLDILDDGQFEQLDYDGLLQFHHGASTWGASVAYRALQRAGDALSQTGLWDRQTLHVTSAHSGPGVRDAVEYVTRCVSRGRYHLTQPERAGQCHKNMAFSWWISDRTRTVSVQLREGFVPEDFFAFVDRIETPLEQPADRDQLERMKTKLTAQLWAEPIHTLFLVANAVRPRANAGLPCTS